MKQPRVRAPGARSKYRSRKIEQAGQTFDSQKEVRRWHVLEQLAAAGQITELRRQVTFVLPPAVRLEGEKRAKPAPKRKKTK